MNAPVDKSPVSGSSFESSQSFDLESFAAKFGGTTTSTVKAGTALFRQGERADSVFYIQAGQVQLTVVSSEGKQAIIAVLGAGDFCGKGALISGKLWSSTATCLTDGVVARIERANMIRAIQQDPLFAEFYIVNILNRTARLRDSLISQLFDSSERRLARTLLLLANYGREGRKETVIGNIDQETLAQMVGTTRSRVNHFMNKFRKLGYIDYNGDIAVHSSLVNVVLQDQPPDEPENTMSSSG